MTRLASAWASKLENSCHYRRPRLKLTEGQDNNTVALPHPASCASFLSLHPFACTRTAHVIPSTPLLVPLGPVRQVQVGPSPDRAPRPASDPPSTTTTTQTTRSPSSTFTFSCRTSTTTTSTAADPSLTTTTTTTTVCEVNSQQLQATSSTATVFFKLCCDTR